MSVARCIPELLGEGRLTKEQADRAQELFDGHSAELRKTMSSASAEALATKRTLEAMDFAAIEKRRRTLLQAKAQDFAEDWLTRGGERFGGGRRGGNGFIPGEGEQGPLNPKAGNTLISLVEARREAVEGEAFGHLRNVLRKHRAIVPGQLRNGAEMDELGMEAFGEASGNAAARELAQAVAETQEWLRLRANAAGANIGKLEKRGFSQHHDSRKVVEAGFHAWFAAESPRLDRARMVSEQTGQPFTDKEFEEVMRSVFDTIASEGFSKRTPGAGGRPSYTSQLGQHRFLHYKSYADWKASQEEFGQGTAFDALLGEVKGMSRAIAAMEILGPNPEATVRYVKDRILGDPALRQPGMLRVRNRAETGAQVVQRIWDEYTGALRQPENRSIGYAFSSYRALATSAKLGTSPVTALSDQGYGMATRAFNGLPIARITADYLKLLNPADPSHRLAAAYLSFVPEVWTSQVAGQARFLAEELTGDVSRHAADGVLRASGLSAITEAGRQAHGLVTFIYATMVRDKRYGELEPAWRAALERYRIGEKEWDELRSAAPETLENGLDLLTPHAMGDSEAKRRFLDMAHNEKNFAVPAPDIQTRSYLNAQVKKGTFLGEVLRSSPLMFRTFTIASMLLHGGRMVQQQSAAGIAGYALAVAAPVTVFGVLSQQLYEILNGRDPRPMDPSTPEGRATWGQGMLRGGALSLLGDLVGLSAQDRYMSLTQYAVGPLIGDLDRARQAASAAIQGDDARHKHRRERGQAQLAQLAKEQVPGSNVWYLRLMVDRMLADQVQTMIDPDYPARARRTQKRAAERGQHYFWAPGETAPRRAPDFSNAVTGGTRQ